MRSTGHTNNCNHRLQAAGIKFLQPVPVLIAIILPRLPALRNTFSTNINLEWILFDM